MKSILFTGVLLFLSLFLSSDSFAQKYITKTGHAYFMSHTDAIDIDGHNHQVAAIADLTSGDIVVIVLIKAFNFSLATADEHFNETYMESDKYPKAVFKGNVPLLKELDLSTDASYEAVATGKLTIHGQTQEVSQKGTLKVKDGKILIDCDFKALIDDYKIAVPKSVKDRVAKQVDVEIDLSLSPKQ